VTDSCRPSFEPHVEIAQSYAYAVQFVLDHLPHTGALLHRSVVAPQVVQRDRTTGERMTRAARITVSWKNGSVLDTPMTRCRAHDAELERAVGDTFDDGLRVEHAERDVQGRMNLRELAEDL
jgi:hypothetical protein